MKITLTWAQSIDGYLGMKGQQTALSCIASLTHTHSLRATHDGILVGIQTILTDNPSLTTRLVEGPSPTPIVLDSRLRTPLDAKIMARNPILVTSIGVAEERVKQFIRSGARILRVGHGNGHGLLDTHQIINELHGMGIKSLMVEGGGTVISSFMPFATDIIITIAPVFLGSGIQYSTCSRRVMSTQQFGDDIVLFLK